MPNPKDLVDKRLLNQDLENLDLFKQVTTRKSSPDGYGFVNEMMKADEMLKAQSLKADLNKIISRDNPPTKLEPVEALKRNPRATMLDNFRTEIDTVIRNEHLTPYFAKPSYTHKPNIVQPKDSHGIKKLGIVNDIIMEAKHLIKRKTGLQLMCDLLEQDGILTLKFFIDGTYFIDKYTLNNRIPKSYEKFQTFHRSAILNRLEHECNSGLMPDIGGSYYTGVDMGAGDYQKTMTVVSKPKQETKETKETKSIISNSLKSLKPTHLLNNSTKD